MEKTLTIITVCLNSEAVIEPTLRSILRDKPAELEYIVIDGASTDAPLDILGRYEQGIDILLSEPDDGIYDAMNKGTRLASGDYVLYLNAGDLLHEAFSLDGVTRSLSEERPDMIWGRSLDREPGGEAYPRKTRSPAWASCGASGASWAS